MDGIALYGNWKAGWAVDRHTVKSIPAGPGSFHTTYSKAGEALNRLKYHDDRSQIPVLARLAVAFLEAKLISPYLDVVLPVPPSNVDRPIQPVFEIARRIGEYFDIRVDLDYLRKTKQTSPLKGIDDAARREAVLKDAFAVRDRRYEDATVLLFDDLFRSGATLRAITDLLYREGRVGEVYVLTLTKSRVKK